MEMLKETIESNEKLDQETQNKPMQAQVKLTPQGQKEQFNTLAIPALYTAVYPFRFWVPFDKDIDLTKPYHPDYIDTLIKESENLTPMVDSLREGFFYVYINGYLHQELRVTLDDDSKAVLQQIDLAKDQGSDKRETIKGLKQPFILVPNDAESIEIGFSAHQWSWLRINTLGGIPEASSYKGVEAASPDRLALNDKRLIAAGNNNALLKEAKEERSKRLQSLSFRDATDVAEWNKLDTPVKKSGLFIEALESEYQDLAAKTGELFLDDIVTDVCSFVVHDHLSLLMEYCTRVNLGLQQMAGLLSDLQNPNHAGDKKKLFPFSKFFTSASLIHKELLNYQAGDNNKYLDNARANYRDYVHIQDVRKAIGFDYRKQVNRYIGIAKDNLEEFLSGEVFGDTYLSLKEDFDANWKSEVLDLLACSKEKGLAMESSCDFKEPFAELSLEYVSGLFKSLLIHPQSLDIAVGGSAPDIKEYKDKLQNYHFYQWIKSLVSEDDELWRSITDGKLKSMANSNFAIQQTEDDQDTDKIYFDISRRGWQAMSGLFQVLGFASPHIFGKHAKKGLYYVATYQKYTGVSLSDFPLRDAMEAAPYSDNELKRILQKELVEGQYEIPQLISMYLKKTKPLVLDALGGAGVAEIKKSRADSRRKLLENQENEKQALNRQWNRELQEKKIQAEDDLAEKQAELVAENERLKEAVEAQESNIRELNEAYNKKVFDQEGELSNLNKDLDDAKLTADKASKDYKSLEAEYRSAQSEFERVGRSLSENVASQAAKDTAIKKTSNDIVAEASKLQENLEARYPQGGHQQVVYDFLQKEDAEKLQPLKQQQQELVKEQARLEGKERALSGRVKGLESSLEKLKKVSEKAALAAEESAGKVKDKQAQLNDIKANHQTALSKEKSDLATKKQAHGDYQDTMQKQRNAAFGEASKAKADAKNDKLKKQSYLENNNKKSLSVFDDNTNKAVDQRIKDEKHHLENNKKLANQARNEGRPAFNLQNPDDLKAWQEYNLFDGEKAKLYVEFQENRNNYFDRIKEQAELREQVRPNGDAKLTAIRDPEKYANLSEAKQKLLDTLILGPEDIEDFTAIAKSHVLMIDPGKSNDSIKYMMGEEAKQIADSKLSFLKALDIGLAAFEAWNLMNVLSQNNWKNSSFQKGQIISGILDFAAAMESVAITTGAVSKAYHGALAAGRSTVAWRMFSLGALNIVASGVTFAMFSWEWYYAVFRDNGDDAKYSLGTLMFGSAMLCASATAGAYATIASTATTAATILGAAATTVAAVTLGVGVAAMLVGAFLYHCVYRPNDDLLEYVLAHGPFGADKNQIPFMQDVRISMFETNGSRTRKSRVTNDLEVGLDGTDQVIIDGDDFTLLRVDKGVLGNIGSNFIEHSDGSYSYETDAGELFLGKVGEPFAGQSFNDPADIEQYFKKGIQEDSGKRFSEDLYTDEGLDFVVKASEWLNDDGGDRYFESLISGLYPLNLEVKMVPKRYTNHGRMKNGKGIGNLLKVKYRADYLQAGTGKLLLNVKIRIDKGNVFNVAVSNLSNDLVQAEYLKDGSILNVIDVDSDLFAETFPKARLLKSLNEYPFEATISCEHPFDEKNTYYQPPKIEGKSGTARVKGDFYIRARD